MKKTIIALGVMLGSVVSTSYAFPDQAMTIVVPYAAPCVRIVVTLPFQLKQAVKDTHHGPLFP